MSQLAVVYESKHRIKFSELDPYDHLRTSAYSCYYVDHRMEGLRKNVGWDLKTLGQLSFMVWTKRMEIDFLRPVVGDQEITIRSFVRDFRGADAQIECKMVNEGGEDVSRCLMIVAYVDRATNRAKQWPAETRALFFEEDPA